MALYIKNNDQNISYASTESSEVKGHNLLPMENL